LTVAGCSNQTVSNIIKGLYSAQGSNHGRPVYKKDGPPGSVSVLIYFWDERDGPSFTGWWFGPKVGGDQVWAYNGDKNSPTPPLANWKVPWDGPVDPSLRIQLGPQSAAAPAGRGLPDPNMQRQQDEEERRRREVELKRRQREDEERARKEAEMKKRREEEEVRRQEHAAALNVRKVIQRVRVATPENYDELRAELEEAQAANLEALGMQAQKVSQEAQETLKQAQKRIDEINEQRAEDERRRVEEERKAKEEAENVAKLLKEVAAEVVAAEDKVAQAQEASKVISEGENETPEAMAEAATATEKVLEASRTSLEESLKVLDDKWKEMGDGDAARKVRREMDELNGKLLGGRRQLERLAQTVSAARDKAKRKAAALKKDRERRDAFDKHDSDKDGQLNRSEVVAFSKAEFQGFDLPEPVLNKIMQILQPITFEKFHAMHLKVAIARSEAQARAKRAEEAEQQRILDEKRQAVQKIMDEASDLLTAAEDLVGEAETKSKPLAKENSDMLAKEIEATAATCDELAKRAEAELVVVLERLQKAEDECEAKEELNGYDKKDVPRLRKKHEAVKGRAEKVAVGMRKARERAVRKAYAEVDQKRLEAVSAIRVRMGAEGKSGEQLFTDLAGDGPLARSGFVSLLQGLTDLQLEDGQAERLFEHVAVGSESITKERFLELIRLYYKCVKGTVLNEDISIKSKTVRRLEVGEVLEALEGPSKEQGVGVQRVRCQCVQDEAIGWATIAGNQGTPFLEPGGNFYTVVKETLLTDDLSVQDSRTVRRLAKGEVIEVVEFHKKDASVDVKRIKGKAKLDGAMGWITVASNQGTTFLEPC